MLWYELSLSALATGLALTIICSPFERLWMHVRPVVVLAVKLAAVLMGTWLLITYAQTNSLPILGATSAQTVDGGDLGLTVLQAAERSLVVMLAASVIGTGLGLGLAYLLVAPSATRRLGSVALFATLLWVFPTFLIAALVQELQAQIYGASGIGVSGGYGTASVVSALWAGLVLAIRPAAYVFRQARAVLAEETKAAYFRVALAKGLDWRAVRRRYVLRPTVPTLTSNWVTAFRIMIGSLPLVEFFFAYPGLGLQLILALGISYPDQIGTFQPDLAIGLISAMAAILMSLEVVAKWIQTIVDPRLGELRSQPA